MFRLFKSISFLLAALPILLLPAGTGAQTPHPVDRAFSLIVLHDTDGALTLRWTAAPGNYLYRESLKASFDGRGVPVETPPGREKDDPNFGHVEVYHGHIDGRVRGLPPSGVLQVSYQGCAEQGICYPPILKAVDLTTLSVSNVKLGLGGAATLSDPETAVDPASATAGDSPSVFLAGSPLLMAIAFLGFGVLLSLTPCVFPMIPILSAMLADAGEQLSMGRGFLLSTTYVVAMAAAYGLVGLAAGWSGANLQALLQTPWVLSLAAAVFTVLALSMIGLFEIALPSTLAARLSGRGKRGSVGGAAILGFGSALIVSPCVTPPLAAAMLYAVQTGEAARGAAALFFLGLGMGLPLIAVGTFGTRILPRSGPWLAEVRRAFGVVFLGVAAMLVARMLPASAAVGLWGALAIIAGVFLGGLDKLTASSSWRERFGKATGLIATIYGVTLVVGAAGGASDPARPLGFLAEPRRGSVSLIAEEKRVSSPAAFDAALAATASRGQPVLVSFTADWCTVCKSNEALMNEPEIRDRLRTLPIIAADITTQDAPSRALMSRFSVVGPPTLFLLDERGHEIPGSRIIGPITAEDISRQLSRAGS